MLKFISTFLIFYFSVLCLLSQSAFFYGVIEMKKIFFDLLTEISYGLVRKEFEYEKKQKDDNYRYFQQPELVSSIQKLALFMLENGIVDEIGCPLAPSNETEAILHYFSKPLNEWPSAENHVFQKLILFADEEERLVHVYGDTYFYTTEWCKELADQCRKFNQDIMQQDVFIKLRQVTEDEQYRFLRKFIIEHPIIDLKAKYDFERKGKMLGLESIYLEEFINVAYEKLPENVLGECSHCGWTVMHNKFQERSCIDSRCKYETDGFIKIQNIEHPHMKMRLKSGVMKYICLPGKDELELVEYCNKKKVTAILWPEKDRYDIQINNRNQILAIDVKSYYSPYALAFHIEENRIFNRLNENEQPILVIPDHRLRKRGYIQIVQRVLPENIQCLSMKQVKRLITEGVTNGKF